VRERGEPIREVGIRRRQLVSLHRAGPAGHSLLEIAQDLLIRIDSPVFAHLPILLSAPASRDI
jgi:hypothetical protein